MNNNNAMTRLGSVDEFDKNWKDRKETAYNHWTRGIPANQIQLAFRGHWTLFSELMEGREYHSCLEVGSGRGSISSYFADHGFDCTLLDSSASVLETAKDIFTANGHKAKFVHADALNMPFPADNFDVVVSIGLLEHFEEIEEALSEQIRVLKPGGLFLGYIVPERPDNIQKWYRWINLALKAIATMSGSKKKAPPKTAIFRSDYGSERYLNALSGKGITDIQVMGLYPLPMISHSPEFPFSLLPKPLEKILTLIFRSVLKTRKLLYKRNPWICAESTGQAFLLAFRKA